jgi:hypothetical protein
MNSQDLLTSVNLVFIGGLVFSIVFVLWTQRLLQNQRK